MRNLIRYQGWSDMKGGGLLLNYNLAEFLPKLDFTMSDTDAPKRRLRSLTKVWSTKDSVTISDDAGQAFSLCWPVLMWVPFCRLYTDSNKNFRSWVCTSFVLLELFSKLVVPVYLPRGNIRAFSLLHIFHYWNYQTFETFVNLIVLKWRLIALLHLSLTFFMRWRISP